jgi:hypothetical protein
MSEPTPGQTPFTGSSRRGKKVRFPGTPFAQVESGSPGSFESNHDQMEELQDAIGERIAGAMDGSLHGMVPATGASSPLQLRGLSNPERGSHVNLGSDLQHIFLKAYFLLQIYIHCFT